MNSVDDLIKEIALKHGLTVGRNDPILVLHTVNAQLLSDTEESQRKLLNQFKEEIELIFSRAQVLSKETSERWISNVVAANLESSNIALKENTAAVVKKLNETIETACEAQIEKIKFASQLNLFAALITCLSALFLAYLVITK